MTQLHNEHLGQKVHDINDKRKQFIAELKTEIIKNKKGKQKYELLEDQFDLLERQQITG